MRDVLSNKRIEKSYDAISDSFGYDFWSLNNKTHEWVRVRFNDSDLHFYLKKDSNTGVFLWLLRNFKGTYFEKHLRTAASQNLSRVAVFRRSTKYVFLKHL